MATVVVGFFLEVVIKADEKSYDCNDEDEKWVVWLVGTFGGGGWHGRGIGVYV